MIFLGEDVDDISMKWLTFIERGNDNQFPLWWEVRIMASMKRIPDGGLKKLK
jgi:hypothetical protein